MQWNPTLYHRPSKKMSVHVYAIIHVYICSHTHLGCLAMLDIKKKYTKYIVETKGFRMFSEEGIHKDIDGQE